METMTAETTNPLGYGSIAHSKITFNDWYNSTIDKKFPETQLITNFTEIIKEIDQKGELSTYEKTLKTDKSELQLKLILWKMVTTPYGVLEDKWNDEIEPKFKKTLFKPETEKYPFNVADKESATGFRTVTKVRLTNNLTYANENNLYEVINFIVENFELSNELKNDFNTVIEKINSVKTESVDIKKDTANKLINAHVVKANSTMYDIAHQFVKNRLETKLLELESIIAKHEMSVNFISWKLKAITRYNKEKKINTLNTEAIDMNSKIAEKCKTDKVFSSLMNIANKWHL